MITTDLVSPYSHKPTVCEELHAFVQMLSDSFRAAKPVHQRKFLNYIRESIAEVLNISHLFQPVRGLQQIFN